MDNQKEAQAIRKSLHLTLEKPYRILWRKEPESLLQRGFLTDISMETLGFEADSNVDSLTDVIIIVQERENLKIPVIVSSTEPRGETYYMKANISEKLPIEKQHAISDFIEDINLAQQGYTGPESVRELEKQLEVKPPKEKLAGIVEEKELSSEEEFEEYVLEILNKTNKPKEIVDKIGGEREGKFYIQPDIFPILEAIDDIFKLQTILAGKFFQDENEREKACKKIHQAWKEERKSYKNIYDQFYDKGQKGLEDYLGLDAEIKELEKDVKQLGDKGYSSIAPDREELKEFLQPTNLDDHQKDSIISAFGEGIENAIEHGEKGKPDMIKPGDKIRISYGYDREKIVIIVTDLYGNLTEETIERYKNLSKENFGLDTTTGMGIFIINSIVHKLDYNIKEGKFTQLIAVYTRRN